MPDDNSVFWLFSRYMLETLFLRNYNEYDLFSFRLFIFLELEIPFVIGFGPGMDGSLFHHFVFCRYSSYSLVSHP